MKPEQQYDEGLIAVFIAIVFLTGCLIISVVSNATLKDEAIERGYMEHNQKTGERQWVEPTK